jgi:L-ornithine N5-oxygenase
MTNREVELLAVGGGPANLALAVAIEELGIDGLAENSLVIERGHTVEWQRGLLLPWTKSQVAFAKDLVTLRNPRSKFTFLNYLRSVGRLDDFINMGSFTPYRVEISGYLSWVAESLRKVKFELGCECTSIAPVRDSSGTLTGWLTKLADGSTISSRYLCPPTGWCTARSTGTGSRNWPRTSPTGSPWSARRRARPRCSARCRTTCRPAT